MFRTFCKMPIIHSKLPSFTVFRRVSKITCAFPPKWTSLCLFWMLLGCSPTRQGISSSNALKTPVLFRTLLQVRYENATIYFAYDARDCHVNETSNIFKIAKCAFASFDIGWVIDGRAIVFYIESSK